METRVCNDLWWCLPRPNFLGIFPRKSLHFLQAGDTFDKLYSMVAQAIQTDARECWEGALITIKTYEDNVLVRKEEWTFTKLIPCEQSCVGFRLLRTWEKNTDVDWGEV